MPETASNFGKFGDIIQKGYNGLEFPPKVHGELELSSVQGRDDLRPIRDTRIYPYRCICFLKMKAQDGADLTGTGWLAGPQIVITAGHCVFDHERGGKMVQIEVIPGCKGDDPRIYPYGSYISKFFEPAEKWKKQKLQTHDYGVIFLPKNSRLGENLGYFGYADWGRERLEGLDVCLSGYPSDDFFIRIKLGTQWYDKRELTNVSDFQLHYQIDTLPGDSGAPIWRIDKEKNRYVVGIHNYGSTGANFATRINDAVFQQIENWREQGT